MGKPGLLIERAVTHRRWWVLAVLLLIGAVALWQYTEGAVRLLAALPAAGYFVLTTGRDRWKDRARQQAETEACAAELEPAQDPAS